MASFTFEAGNTRALLRLPLYALGAVASFFVPRTDKLWVVGSGIGVGEGALPVYERARTQPGVRVVWLATTDRELTVARAAGFDAELKSSWRGLWLTLRARVLIVTHGAGDLNRYGTRGGFLVQLWHGIPLKKLHLDSPVARRSRVGGALVGAVLTRGYRIAGARINLFPVASERIVGRIASAFGTPRDRIVATGDPRDDVLLDGEPAERRQRARDRLEKAVGPLPSRVVLYAPTWRDGAPDPAAPDDATWDLIAAWLERYDTALVVRIHPLGKGDYASGPQRSDRVRLLDATMLTDVNPILNAVDAIVTDYSSIAFDYALIDGPTVFLATDVAGYVRARGLYEPYATFSGGRHVSSWRAALERLDEALTGAAAIKEHTRWLRDEHFDHVDAGATERVIAEIHRRLGNDKPASAPRRRRRITGIGLVADHLALTFAEPVDEAYLDGPRGRVDARIVGSTAEFGLLGKRWGTPGLALPSGDYRLVLGGAHPTTRVELPAELPAETHDAFRIELRADDGGLVVAIRPPVARVGAGWYRRARPAAEDAVYFESFYGRTAGDNPLGIDRALASMYPDVRRYWSVVDGSIALPDGAIRLIEGSAEWWRVRASARVLVVNDWLRWPYRRRPHQHVLQTWHGTMLKRLALDRPHVSARTRLAVLREQRRWDALLAQNAYSARIFRTAYAVSGPIWETGYPRNDVFAEPARAARVRAILGVPAGARVVLYAPTWRDDRNELVDDLDLVRFAAALPADHVVLVRGHSRTLGHGRDLRGERLTDVTSYPDVADLMLAADVLVTDYSSVMFDFAATGKPMVFFVPDLEHYGERLRGFYFDLLADAPGPVVTTAEELHAAIDAPTTDERRYAAWRERFVPHDDGRAGERVVLRIYEEGWLG
jgi:CDP-glycerol glycerophosphotransferase (TagB/SpsB family)